MSNHKVDNLLIKCTRTVNYNTVGIEITYSYAGNSPKGFTQKEINNLIETTQNTADAALEGLKRRVAIPATTRKLNG